MLPWWVFVILWVWAGVLLFQCACASRGKPDGPLATIVVLAIVVVLWPLTPLLDMIFDS